ncbi:ribonuclease H-like domain-containing protein [Tanacetum coccineum]
MWAGSSRMASDININLYNSLFEDTTKRQRTSAPTSELGQYMATNFLITLRPEEFTNFDILAWWKEREIQFLILSAMARDLLTVQASTVASESAFLLAVELYRKEGQDNPGYGVELCYEHQAYWTWFIIYTYGPRPNTTNSRATKPDKGHAPDISKTHVSIFKAATVVPPRTNTDRGRILATADAITRGHLPDKGPTPATNSRKRNTRKP